MNRASVQRLSEAYRLLDESGDLEVCLTRYPDLADELRAYAAVRQFVLDRVPSGPEPQAMAAGRALLATAAAGRHEGRHMLRRLSPMGLAGGLAALVLVAGAAAATGGAGVPGHVNGLLSRVGITSDDTGNSAKEAAPTAESHEGLQGAEVTRTTTPGAHGDAVSDAVHNAIASTTPGPGRGEAVSEAACAAAHDRSTLPAGAREAPGQQDQTPPSCEHGNGEVEESATGTPTPTVTPAAPGSERQMPSLPRHGR